MITTRVCRTGDPSALCLDSNELLKWGEDISDSLIITDAMAKERGRVEIDNSYTNRNNKGLNLHQVSYMAPGSIVAIVDGSNSLNGILRSIKIQVSRSGDSISVGSSISLETNI